MINVRILASNFGDKSAQMTVQEFKDMFAKDRARWAIFAEDTAIPSGQRQEGPIAIDEVKDGMRRNERNFGSSTRGRLTSRVICF